MLEGKTPPETIYRIGRKPDPWQAPDWSRANPDGTFDNRFDDPKGYYRVIYAATQNLSCFLETLARYRRDLSLLSELDEIEGENDFFRLEQYRGNGATNVFSDRRTRKETTPTFMARSGSPIYVIAWRENAFGWG